MTDANDLIKNARLPEARVPLCMRGDLLSRLGELEQEFERARQSDAGNSLASGGAARGVAERMEEVHREIAEHTHIFQFRAMPRRAFRDLQEAHPPREADQLDVAMGFSVDGLQAPLISACCVDPVMSIEQTEALLDVLSDGQIMELFGAALALNRNRVDLPKFETASAILERREQRSRRPAPGGSAGSGSSGGSLAG